MTAQGDRGKTDTTVTGPGGEPVPVRTLLYDRQADREVHLVASADGMRAYLKLAPEPGFAGVTRESVLAVLAAGGVTRGVVEAGVDLLVATQNSADPFAGFFQLARGESMRKGEDGSIEFYVQPTSPEARYDENDSGAIDYKQLNLIENCFAGQRVASILPPGPGRPGRDVFGREIPPAAGEPVRVQAGPGVVVSANGRDFTSEIEGRLVFEDGVLGVSPILEISRDIDYSVGNVDFVGKVLVNGSLLDGFYINAKRGVELRGEMGAARISSEGDVKITGGIKGKNAAIITCRDLQAHYIDDAVVEASGDVLATKEIINSNVKALGRVTVASGAIIGGEVCGFQGVEADTLGSDIGVSTWVMAGLAWTEENRKEEIRARVAELMDRVQSAQILLEPLFGDKEAGSRLGGEQKGVLAELIGELREIRGDLRELLEERAMIDGRDQVGMVNQVNARKMLYMGVSARFSAVNGEVKDSVKGPVSITQDAGANAIRVGPGRELPKARKTTNEEAPSGEAAGG